MKQWVQGVVMSDKKSCCWQWLVVHLRGPCHGQYPLKFLLIALTMGQSPSSKSSQAIQRCEQVNVLPVRMGRLENWTNWWLIKFNKEKCEAHLLGRNNPYHIDRLQNNGLGSSFADQALSILVDRRWTWASSVFSWQRWLIVFGRHLEMSSVGCGPVLSSVLMRHIWTAGYNSVLLCTKDTDLLEEVTKMLEAQEYIVI